MISFRTGFRTIKVINRNKTRRVENIACVYVTEICTENRKGCRCDLRSSVMLRSVDWSQIQRSGIPRSCVEGKIMLNIVKGFDLSGPRQGAVMCVVNTVLYLAS
jgi:hypothetical protein